MVNESNGLQQHLGYDTVHPNAAGYQVMEQVLMEEIKAIHATDQKLHWEKIYQDKSPDQVSWTQSIPQTSLDLIEHANLPKNAAIIDVGGGESHLIDHLLMLGIVI